MSNCALGGAVPLISDNPQSGPIVSPYADLAVVQLAANGPDLPAELEFADDASFKSIAGLLVGWLGYSGQEIAKGEPHDPPLAEFASTEGVAPSNDLAQSFAPETRISRPITGGSSGGPVFVPGGRVVAVLTGNAGKVVGPHYGSAVAIVALRELLAYHDLDSLVSRGEPNMSNRGHPEHRQQLARLRAAGRLAQDADHWRIGHRYRDAAELCNRIVRDCPGYAGVYLTRAKVYLYYLAHRWNSLSDSERRSYSEWCMQMPYYSMPLMRAPTKGG